MIEMLRQDVTPSITPRIVAVLSPVLPSCRNVCRRSRATRGLATNRASTLPPHQRIGMKAALSLARTLRADMKRPEPVITFPFLPDGQTL
jgi:hypothetical protein